MPPPLIWWQRLPYKPHCFFRSHWFTSQEYLRQRANTFWSLRPTTSPFWLSHSLTPEDTLLCPAILHLCLTNSTISCFHLDDSLQKHAHLFIQWMSSTIYWYSLHIWFNLAFLYRDKSTLWLPHTLRLGWYAIEIDYLYSIKSEFWQYQFVFYQLIVDADTIAIKTL